MQLQVYSRWSDVKPLYVKALFLFYLLILILKVLRFARRKSWGLVVPHLCQPCTWRGVAHGSWHSASHRTVLRRATISPAILLKYSHAFKTTNHNKYNILSQSLYLLSELFQSCFAFKIPAIAQVFQAMSCVSVSSLWLVSTLHSRGNNVWREMTARCFAAWLPNTSAFWPPQQPV